MNPNTVQTPQPVLSQTNLAIQPQNNPDPLQSQTFTTVHPEPKKRSLLKKILIFIVSLIILIAIVAGFFIFKGFKDAPQVQDKVTSFMEYASLEKYSDAYSLTSKAFKNMTSLDDFTRILSLYKAQYSGFQSQEQSGFYIQSNTGQPVQYQYTGDITYSGGDLGVVKAVLIKEGGEYKISSIFVTVSIDRAEKFQQTEKDNVLGVTSN